MSKATRNLFKVSVSLTETKVCHPECNEGSHKMDNKEILRCALMTKDYRLASHRPKLLKVCHPELVEGSHPINNKEILHSALNDKRLSVGV